MNILLIQERALVRETAAALLRQELDGCSVLRAASITEAVQLQDAEPTVIVTDLCFEDVEGAEVIERLGQRFAGVPTLVLTLTDDDSFVDLAIAAGARGYLRKDAEPHQLIAAIWEVARGGEYLQPALGLALARRRANNGNGASSTEDPLSPRETDVFRLLVLGHTNVEIATILNVAQRTVEAHRARIFEKLGMRTRAELVRFAIKSGLFDDPDEYFSL